MIVLNIFYSSVYLIYFILNTMCFNNKLFRNSQWIKYTFFIQESFTQLCYTYQLYYHHMWKWSNFSNINSCALVQATFDLCTPLKLYFIESFNNLISTYMYTSSYLSVNFHTLYKIIYVHTLYVLLSFTKSVHKNIKAKQFCCFANLYGHIFHIK